MTIDWKNQSAREEFEELLANTRARKSKWPLNQKLLWVLGVFGLPLLTILGSCR